MVAHTNDISKSELDIGVTDDTGEKRSELASSAVVDGMTMCAVENISDPVTEEDCIEIQLIVPERVLVSSDESESELSTCRDAGQLLGKLK